MITGPGNKKDLRNMGFKGVSMRLAGECAWHTPLAAHTVTLLISESAHVSKSFFYARKPVNNLIQDKTKQI